MDETSLFLYSPFKKELSKILLKFSSFVNDVQDFWLFVQKFENIEKKRFASRKNDNTFHSTSTPGEKLNLPAIYDVSHVVNAEFNIPMEQLYGCLDVAKNHKLRAHLPQFLTLISLYFSFKQKEKLLALKKIRNTQKNLPVYQYKDEILKVLRDERVVIIAGDTGCGKSTQIPQFLWQDGYNRIACTQPRRIACISLSKRVAKETLTEYDSQVGYQIRFEKHRNRETKILFITEGLLLRQTSNEDLLSEYDAVVLDEVHERHLHGDFLLGIMKCLLYQRPDLKLVLMSATINIELFSNYFGELAKVIQIPGRLFPITVQYFPIVNVDAGDGKFDASPYIRILQLIDQKYSKTERGDVLMFLSGTKEITSVVEAAKQYNEKAQSWCILSLHSSLSLDEQDKVFDYPPEGHRKCVISTNIAETSVTIDGIRFVVDSGKVKEMSYDPVCKMQRLKEFWVSKASAEQRKGRAGRTGPGVCFRLYSEKEYNAMSKYTTPEIQRVSLDSVLLQMISMGLPDVRKFPFIEPPDQSSIDNSLLLLKQYGAITGDEQLTEIGKTLSKLPMDLVLGKMLIMGSIFDQVESVLSLASALSVQSPFTHKAFRDIEMQEARKDLESDHGDPITILNVFREWLTVKQECSLERGSNAAHNSRKWCRKRGLEEQRLYEMTKLRTQFKDLLLGCDLINDDMSMTKGKDEMTSAERSIRYGEVKQLKKLKRSHEMDSPKRPKILKADRLVEIEAEDYDEVAGDTDIRDIEFRLRNDPHRIQNLLDGSTATSYKDLTMLKLIFCSALYPQIAIPDTYNSCKSVKEQLFHTAQKSFVSLHPNSFFSIHPEILQLDDTEIIPSPINVKTRLPFSSKHQILYYMSLLETSKAFLVNNLRTPAAQSVLLFAQDIQTDHNFTKIVCDEWMEFRFLLPEAAEKFLIKVCDIRALWQQLLDSRLRDLSSGRLEHKLTSLLLELLRADIVYTIRRLLPADLKTMYKTESTNVDVQSPDNNPFYPNFSMNRNKTNEGIRVAPFLTYNSLVQNDGCDEYTSWNCEKCDLVAAVSCLERLQHLNMHKDSSLNSKDGGSSTKIENCNSRKPNSKLFSCDVCNKKFYFTSVEILRHTKQHQGESV